MDRALAAIELLSDTRFTDILASMEESVPLYRDFLSWEMPQGCSHRNAWVAAALVRKLHAHVTPIAPFVYPEGSGDTWCSMTAQMQRHLGRLLGAGADRLDCLDDLTGRQLELALLARDVAGALEREGHPLDARDVEALACGRGAESPVERLAANAVRVALDAGRYARHRVTPWMLEEVSEAIDEGCGELPCPRTGWPGYELALFRRDPELTVEQICRALREAEGRADLGESLIDVLNVSYTLWALAPLPRWNSLAEVAVRRIALARLGIAAIGAIPLSRVLLEGGGAQADEDSGIGYDQTNSMTMTLANMVEALEGIEREASARREADQQSLQVVDNMTNLNPRQQRVLAGAVVDPEYRVTIASHKQRFGIAYSTARADLLALEGQGLLRLEHDGKAMVFRPGDALPQRPR